MKALDVRDAVKVYSGSVRAVDGVSFDVDQGTVFGLLGPNGAGKTTIIKMIVTLLTVTEGSVSVLGHARPKGDYLIRNCIGYVPQDVSSDAALTGYENLLISAKLYGKRGKPAKDMCESILKQLGLWEAKDRTVKTYSGGMIRKLEIGQAVVVLTVVVMLSTGFADIKLNGNPVYILLTIPVVILLSAVCAGISIFFATVFRTRERVMGFGQLLTLPLFFTSSALYPVDFMPEPLQWLARVNPLTYGVDLLRGLMVTGDLSGALLDVAVLLGYLVGLVLLCSAMFRRMME